MRDKEIKDAIRNGKDFTPTEGLREDILKKAEDNYGITFVRTEEKETKDSGSKKRSRTIVARAVSLAAAVLILMVMLPVVFSNRADAMETIYFDINPSLAITVNRKGTVVSTSAFNEDTVKCFENIDLVGLSVESATEKIISVLDENGYFDSDELTITVCCSNEKRKQEILDSIQCTAEKYEKAHGTEISRGFSEITKEEKEQAKDSGLSPVKYKLIKEILSFDDTFSEEELADKKMKELRDLCEADPGKQKGSENKEHKNNNGKGKGNKK